MTVRQWSHLIIEAGPPKHILPLGIKFWLLFQRSTLHHPLVSTVEEYLLVYAPGGSACE